MHILVLLKKDKIMDSVFFREALNDIILMFPDAFNQIACDACIKCAVAFAR